MAWVPGIDVSHWQTPGAPVIRASGARYAWIKASQGATGRDARMAQHHRVLGDLGMVRGAYHFMSWAAAPARQADNFLRATGPLEWAARPALDVETPSGLTKAATADAILDWLHRVEHALGVVPMIYTGAYYWNAHVEPRPEFERHHVWLARYPTAYQDGHLPPDGATTPSPAPWDDWTVWQFSTAGNLDRNICTPAEYPRILARPGVPTPPTPPTEEFTMDAAAKARFDTIEAQLQTLLDTSAKMAVALRSKETRKVWICSDEGRWHVPDMETLNLLIFTGQVHGLGTDGKVAEVSEDQLDGWHIIDGPR